jgi:uncharacterized ion transporter superfamily protein YfcC
MSGRGTAGSRRPSAVTILSGLIVLLAAPTWIIPADTHDRGPSEAMGKDVLVALFRPVRARGRWRVRAATPGARPAEPGRG